MRMRRGIIGLVVLIAAVGAALGVGTRRAALAQDATPATPAGMTTIAITITAQEFAFEGPSAVEAGLVTVTLTNQGEFRHHAQLFKLNEGVTADQFVAGLETGEAFGLGVAAGGPGTVAGGEETRAILRLGVGQYVALCFVTGRDGIPHYMKGMAFPFLVSGADAGEPDPTAAAEVTLDDFSIALSQDTFTAGEHVWKVTNAGQANHELAIFKLPEGMTVDDYTASIMAAASATPAASPAATPVGSPAAEAPQPTAAGGLKALGTGGIGWAVVDLDAGEYVAVCFVREGEITHASLGMIAGFTVE